MNQADIINLSLEQTVEALGDPTEKVFQVMYQRFPDLLTYKDENEDWENYMFEEIITNFMSFGDDPETALLTIKDMVVHHELIGVPREAFKGMYDTLYEVITSTFYGPYETEMKDAWKQNVSKIHSCIETATA
jgi:hemoglobin-like flavoprotein